MILYSARLTHVRHRVLTRRFAYRVRMWLVDLDDLPRSRLLSFRAADHLGTSDRSIRANLDAWLVSQGIERPARVLMLTAPRSFGYVFNPLTVYWCHDAAGAPLCVVAEVHNTYGERHCYPLSVETRTATTDKTFYVSPFFAVEGRYDIRTSLSEDTVAVAISLTSRDGERLFSAAVHGGLQPATRGRTLRRVLGNPLPSQRVSALIRWHGIRLWLRRLPVVARPPHQTPKGFA